MTRRLFSCLTLLACLVLAACAGAKKEDIEGPLALAEDELGPETKDLVKDLPKGLVGDAENARYTNDNLRGEDEGD